MNLKIYKSINCANPYNIIDYFIYNEDALTDPQVVNYLHIMLQKTGNFTITSRTILRTQIDSSPHTESTFLDLLITTGITQGQIEYIYRNIDFNKYNISIMPRLFISSQTIFNTGTETLSTTSYQSISNPSHITSQ